MEANDGRQAQGAYIPQELLKEISKVNNRLLIGIPREPVSYTHLTLPTILRV